MNFFNSHFKPFFKRRSILETPWLVAVSGGPDSMALLHLMLEYQRLESVMFGVAHVDHGWRSESRREAEELEKLCADHAIPFHLSRLVPSDLKANLEAECRKKRQGFFKILCRKYGYTVVMTGHHLDDQAETVLKRIFEGAKLENCRGMMESTELEGVCYWRPLLGLRKQQIIKWLETKKISYFQDSTNQDCQFLRSRLRQNILPEFSRKFGKEVGPGLSFFGREADALNNFMASHSKKWLDRAEKGMFGTLLDLQDEPPVHLFEARYVITELFPEASREIAYCAAEDLLKGSANKQYAMGNNVLYVDRKRLFLVKRIRPAMPVSEVPLMENGVIGPWRYQVQKVGQFKRLNNWKQAFYGHLQLPLKGGVQGCVIGILPMDESVRKELKKKRSGQQVPAFIKQWVPVIRRGEEVVCDFLEGDERQIITETGLSITLYVDSH